MKHKMTSIHEHVQTNTYPRLLEHVMKWKFIFIIATKLKLLRNKIRAMYNHHTENLEIPTKK